MGWPKARQIGRPGRSLINKAWRTTAAAAKNRTRLVRFALMTLGVAIFGSLAVAAILPGQDFLAGSAFGMLLAGGLAYLLWMQLAGDGSMSWRVGSMGELWTADQLGHLAKGWTVLNTLMVPAADGTAREIDHIAVGPGGVIVIDSKVWPNKNHRIDTTSSPEIDRAAAGARRQAAVVRLFLHPLDLPSDAIQAAVVFWGAGLVSPREPLATIRNGVRLLHGRDAKDWARSRRGERVLGPNQIASVVTALRSQVVQKRRWTRRRRREPVTEIARSAPENASRAINCSGFVSGYERHPGTPR